MHIPSHPHTGGAGGLSVHVQLGVPVVGHHVGRNRMAVACCLNTNYVVIFRVLQILVRKSILFHTTKF